MKNILFILGLPDNKQVTLSGLDERGQFKYIWHGNTDFAENINIAGTQKQFLPIIWFSDPARSLTKPDIVMNCINDCDTAGKSLEKAIFIERSIRQKWPDVKIFNAPGFIALTAREKIYESFSKMPGLIIPKTVRVQPRSVEEVFTCAEKNKIDFPFLMRSAGTHNAADLVRVNDKGVADKAALESFAFDGRDYYLTQFVDTCGKSGVFEKARLVAIDGNFYPRHLMSSDNWLVSDTHENYMTRHEAAIQKECDFILHWRDMIAPDALQSMQDIYNRVGLDYLGFDFALQEDGTAVIFEINPAQNTFISLDTRKFPYMRDVQNTIVQALNTAITHHMNGEVKSGGVKTIG